MVSNHHVRAKALELITLFMYSDEKKELVNKLGGN